MNAAELINIKKRAEEADTFPCGISLLFVLTFCTSMPLSM